MIIQALQDAAGERVRAWAARRGAAVPEEIPFSAPPPRLEADLCLPWPLQAAKALKAPPLEVASELARELADLPGVEPPRASAPGFVNFRFTPEALLAELDAVVRAPGSLGARPGVGRRKVLLEFVSANPTGPLHLASGRAATLGDSLARILRRVGHEVGTEYYVNDAGRQVELLGESVKARFDELRGRPPAFPEEGYRGGYVRDLAAQAPPEAEGWTAGRFASFAVEAMLEQHRRDMELFGVSFDRWFRESELHAADAVNRALASLRGRGMAYDRQGASWLGSSAQEGSEDDKDRVLVKSDGRPTYFLADIAYHKDKYDRGWGEVINIWGADHHGYVPRMKAAVAALGRAPGDFHVIIHQLVRLFRGTEAVKMSKRSGEFVTLRELVEEAGRDACRFFFAQRTPNAHMNFDLELARKQSQENPVYYVQYVHARISSIFRQAASGGAGSRLAGYMLTEPEERALLVHIARFSGALAACEAALSPHPLATYLTELAGLFHPFYERCRVLDTDEPAKTAARLRLCAGARAAIAEGLGLLGVSAPDSM